MRLSELVKIAGIGEISGGGDPEITGVQSDSRLVTPGSLFVAVKGTLTDGRDYMDDAIERGAVAIVCSSGAESAAAVLTAGNVLPADAGKSPADNGEQRGKSVSTFNAQLSMIETPDSADALGRIASAWYGKPSERLTLVGVTGT
ncbi:MAG: Mur ligase domain-containing protein, partial [Tannerella sp.]|nr:Mur ligase domain-containing protein [Tannerella sp.]